MTSSGEVLARMRAICLSLPDTKETLTWGEPHFRVFDKIFAGCGTEKQRLSIGCKLKKEHQAAIVKRPGFSIAPYVGRHGWISIDAAVFADWDEIEELIRISYRLIAPKKSLAKLDAVRTQPAAARKKPQKRAGK